MIWGHWQRARLDQYSCIGISRYRHFGHKPATQFERSPFQIKISLSARLKLSASPPLAMSRPSHGPWPLLPGRPQP